MLKKSENMEHGSIGDFDSGQDKATSKNPKKISNLSEKTGKLSKETHEKDQSEHEKEVAEVVTSELIQLFDEAEKAVNIQDFQRAESLINSLNEKLKYIIVYESNTKEGNKKYKRVPYSVTLGGFKIELQKEIENLESKLPKAEADKKKPDLAQNQETVRRLEAKDETQTETTSNIPTKQMEKPPKQTENETELRPAGVGNRPLTPKEQRKLMDEQIAAAREKTQKKLDKKKVKNNLSQTRKEPENKIGETVFDQIIIRDGKVIANSKKSEEGKEGNQENITDIENPHTAEIEVDKEEEKSYDSASPATDAPAEDAATEKTQTATENENPEEKARVRRAKYMADYYNDDSYSKAPRNEGKNSYAKMSSKSKTVETPKPEDATESDAENNVETEEDVTTESMTAEEETTTATTPPGAESKTEAVPEVKTKTPEAKAAPVPTEAARETSDERRRKEAERTRKVEAKEAEEAAERLKIFVSKYTKGLAGFANVEEALEDAGFITYLQIMDKHWDNEENMLAVENNEVAHLTKRYEQYARGRFVAIQLSKTYNADIAEKLGSGFKLPKEAENEIQSYIAELIFNEDGAKHLEELYASMERFVNLPEEIKAAEDTLQEELKKRGTESTRSLRENLTFEMSKRDGHIKYADKLGQKPTKEAKVAEKFRDQINLNEYPLTKAKYEEIKTKLDVGGKYKDDELMEMFGMSWEEVRDLSDELMSIGVLRNVWKDKAFEVTSDISKIAIDPNESGTTRPFRPVAGMPDTVSGNGVSDKEANPKSINSKEKGADEIDKKELGFVGKWKKINELVKDGYLTKKQATGGWGILGKSLFMTATIKIAAENIRHERNKYQQALERLDELEQYELQTKNDYQLLRKNLLLHLKPSKEIKRIFNEDLSRQIRERIEGVTGDDDNIGSEKIDELERQQAFLGKIKTANKKESDQVRKIGFTGQVKEGIFKRAQNDKESFTFLDEPSMTEIQGEIDESFKVTLHRKIARMIDKETIQSDKGYANFEAKIIEIAKDPFNGNTSYGSKQGLEARKMIIGILEGKLEDIKGNNAGKNTPGKKQFVVDFRTVRINQIINKLKAIK